MRKRSRQLPRIPICAKRASNSSGARKRYTIILDPASHPPTIVYTSCRSSMTPISCLFRTTLAPASATPPPQTSRPRRRQTRSAPTGRTGAARPLAGSSAASDPPSPLAMLWSADFGSAARRAAAAPHSRPYWASAPPPSPPGPSPRRSDRRPAPAVDRDRRRLGAPARCAAVRVCSGG